MARMKQIYEQIVEDIAWGRLPNPAKAPRPAPPTLTKTLFILSCNGEPLSAYVSRDVAEYEMWVCRHGDERKGEVPPEYKITTVPVCTEEKTWHA